MPRRRSYASLVPRADRDAVQAAARAAAHVVVVAWLFVEDVRAWLPLWLPLVLLGATELEFVLRGRGQRPGRRTVAGRPGPEDADLGFGEFVEEEDGYRYVPPPPRPPRGRRVGWLVGALAAAVVVLLAVRSDRAATWQGLAEDDRAQAEARFESEARLG